jgi:hypothetical protein
VLSWLAPGSNGGSKIVDYGFDRSTDGGVTWSAITWFGSIGTTADSATFPTLSCANLTPGGAGCRYRVHARNAVGTSPASKAVAVWIPPSAARTPKGAPVDATYATASLTWSTPTTTGGLPIDYQVLASMDGGAFTPATTTSSLAVIVPCTGTLTCSYKVVAHNVQGSAPATSAVSIMPAPGRPQSLGVRNLGTDLGTGVSPVTVSWYPPTTGMAAVSYRYATCIVPAGATTGCTDTSSSWSAATTVSDQPAPITRSADCPDGIGGCYYRVAAVNARGGQGPWRTTNLQPWAPYNVSVVPGPTTGDVTIKFKGPSESGPNGAPKYYKAFVCTTDCARNAGWRDTGLSIAYPPSGTSPYIAGVYACGENIGCQVRMQFVAGDGAVGPVSAPASAHGLSLGVTAPADNTLTSDNTPAVAGQCTIGAGTVTATVQPGGVTVAAACTGLGTWSGAVASALADGDYTISATQTGLLAGAVSNTNKFTVDTRSPVVTLLSPVSSASLTNSDVVFSGACSENGRPVTVTVTGPPGVTLTTSCAAGAWSTSQLLPNGSYTAVATQTDSAGNTGASTTNPFTVNSTTPVVTVQTPVDGAILATAQPSVSGLCTTSAGAVAVTISGATSATRSTPCVATAWTLSPSSTLADGLYAVTASQTVGTITFVSDPNTFRVDTVAPNTTDDSATFGPAWRNASATVALTPTDPSPASGVATTYYTTDGTTPTTSSAQGTSIVLTTDGVYAIKYFSVDRAGNAESVRTATAQIRIDKTNPAVSIAFPLNSRRYNTTRWNAGCSPAGICGTSGDALSGVASIGVRVQRQSDSRYWNGATWVTDVQTLSPTGTTSWDLPLAASALSDGVAYTVTAIATDAAGNTATATSTFTYDTTGPKVSSVSSSNGNWALAAGDTFTVTFDGAIDPLSLPSTATLTLRNNGGDCNSVVTSYQISGLTAAAATTGSCGYLKGTGGTLTVVTWDGTITVAGNQVSFTVTGGCKETGCAASLTSTAPPTNRQNALSFTPVSTIADTAGNLVVGTTTNYCRNGATPCGAPW